MQPKPVEAGREMRRIRQDYLVVGAGFAGCVIAERIASRLGDRVLLIDRRNHLGGNAFDYLSRDGVLVHKYGPHIFHTNSQRVWDYLSGFTEWIPYEHRVLAQVDGKLVPVPFNLTSIRMTLGKRESDKLEKLLFSQFDYGDNVPILTLLESEVPEIRTLADFIYRKIFLGYTIKQWQLTPRELDPSVTARVPVRLSTDDRYFQDEFQAMPKEGYNALFKKLVSNNGIEIRLETDYHGLLDYSKFKKIIYTGPIDAFFDFKHGELPYRSLDFEFKYHEEDTVQPVAQINFPNDFDYTRTTEFKHMTHQQIKGTVIVTEYPKPHVRNVSEPHYPIPVESSRVMLRNYQKEMLKLKGKVVFIGRLAEYRYFNMDQIVERALEVFDKEIMNGAV